nr:hypothetical protein [Tanacetum cinerariifolium]
DIPIGRLYRTHLGGPCKALTARKSVRLLPFYRLALRYTSHHLDHFTSRSSSCHSSLDHSSIRHSISDHSSYDHSSSGHSILGHSLSGHTPPDTTVVEFSMPPRFVYPSLARKSWCSEAYRRWRSTLLSTMYTPTTSESSAKEFSFELSARLSHKRCRSPAATVPSSIHNSRALDIDTDLLVDIKADAIAVEVAVDIDVKARVGTRISVEVDVGVNVEDKVKDEVESSEREKVDEVMQDIYGHVMEIPLQRVEDIETGQRELEARSLIAGGERASYLSRLRP